MVKVNGITIGNETFPNNEHIFKSIHTNGFKFVIDFKYSTDMDIAILMMVKKYLDDKYTCWPVTLIMKYCPYSRMDRTIEGYMFSLKYFCQLINGLNFDTVKVLDPHSSITTALLDRCQEISIQPFVDRAIAITNVDFVFYPDNGAMKRYSEIIKLPSNIEYFYGNKKRNLNTGEILRYELVDYPDVQGKRVLIIDDLCAKGFTFYNAAEKIKDVGADKVYLYVSHCESSIYNGKLLQSKLVDKIFTTDSILSDWSSKIICNIEE